jgi:pimeloyl-ACP methyl ester carboxylesterase
MLLIAGLAVAAPAAAAPYVAVKGASGPGPAKYDRVFVQKFGPPRANRVMVLVPGFLGGAGDFRLIARDIVRRVPGLQVWALDRRQQAFEDTRVFAHGDPDRAQAHYLGFRYRRVVGKDVPFVGRWGLKLALRDLRRVVLQARAGGRRKVILGGHSLGASTTVAYASWDFRGRPGYRDLEGLVLIDGGLLGTFRGASVKRARTELREYRRGEVFDDILGSGIPEIAGIFVELGALYARTQPQARSALQQNALIPPAFKPPFDVTNQAFLGSAFDKETTPPGFDLIRINAGRVAPEGDPRRWVNGELTPIERFARAFGTERPNAIDWYFPRRLRLDVDAVSRLRRTKATKLLRLRPFHAKEVDLPLYAYQTDLTDGRVIRGARRFIGRSDVGTFRLVSDPGASHLDPLVAAPRRNLFLKTVVPFLKKNGN